VRTSWTDEELLKQRDPAAFCPSANLLAVRLPPTPEKPRIRVRRVRARTHVATPRAFARIRWVLVQSGHSAILHSPSESADVPQQPARIGAVIPFEICSRWRGRSPMILRIAVCRHRARDGGTDGYRPATQYWHSGSSAAGRSHFELPSAYVDTPRGERTDR
jgi:hypothetical protein